MTKIQKLNDIEVYTMALNLARNVYTLTRQSPLSKDFSLIDQLRRASLSVFANIAEGFGRRTKKDFIQFLSIALGSANEVIAYLDFISLEYKMETNTLQNDYDILARKIYSFRSYLMNEQQTTNNK